MKGEDMTREEMRDAIVDTLDGWDLDSIVQFAKEHMEESLKYYDDKALLQEYRSLVDKDYSGKIIDG